MWGGATGTGQRMQLGEKTGKSWKNTSRGITHNINLAQNAFQGTKFLEAAGVSCKNITDFFFSLNPLLFFCLHICCCRG